VVAALVRHLGAHQLALAEDAVQDALLRAVQRWPYQGVPDRPDAWLYEVARRIAYDRIARDGTAERAAAQGDVEPPTALAAPADPDALGDDQLTMMFLACHPAISEDAQVMLTLRVVCGLTVREIAAALLAPEPTIAQRLVRAKRTLREVNATFELPSADEISARRGPVLRALYLLFAEGYAASTGDSSVRRELCAEALRLAEALARASLGASSDTAALLALMHLQASRLAARETADGVPIPLDAQDRALWDRAAIARGFAWFDRSMEEPGAGPSEYQLQAAIASVHAATVNGATTDWPLIRKLYDQLLTLAPSPFVRLNHALAVARVDGPTAGLELLDDLEQSGELRGYHLLPAMRAALLRELGDVEGARVATREALGLARTGAERRLLGGWLAS
jgi:RNA polymerase sigma-70 factor (ECF subfamily)